MILEKQASKSALEKNNLEKNTLEKIHSASERRIPSHRSHGLRGRDLECRKHCRGTKERIGATLREDYV